MQNTFILVITVGTRSSAAFVAIATSTVAMVFCAAATRRDRSGQSGAASAATVATLVFSRATIAAASTFLVVTSTQLFMDLMNRMLTGSIVAAWTVSVTAVAIRATIARTSFVTKTNFGMAMAMSVNAVIHDVDSLSI